MRAVGERGEAERNPRNRPPAGPSSVGAGGRPGSAQTRKPGDSLWGRRALSPTSPSRSPSRRSRSLSGPHAPDSLPALVSSLSPGVRGLPPRRILPRFPAALSGGPKDRPSRPPSAPRLHPHARPSPGKPPRRPRHPLNASESPKATPPWRPNGPLQPKPRAREWRSHERRPGRNPAASAETRLALPRAFPTTSPAPVRAPALAERPAPHDSQENLRVPQNPPPHAPIAIFRASRIRSPRAHRAPLIAPVRRAHASTEAPMPATLSPPSTRTDAPPRDPSAAPTPRASTHFASSLSSHASPPRSSAPSAFSSPSLHDPDAMTDIRAHVLVNDLIKHDWSIERLADAWHITYAQAELLVALPIVQREIRAYHALTRIRNDLINASRPEASTRAMLRILDLPLLDPDEPGYTCHAANARANLLRITATRLLFGRTTHTPSSSSTRSSAPSPRASTHSAPSSSSSSTLLHSSPPRSSDSSVPSAFSSSSDFSIHIPTERAPSDTTITRVACLLAEQACSDNSRPCPEAHACASAGMPPDTSPPSTSSAFPASSPSSNSPLPSPTACPAGALTDLHPASSLKDDADSSPRHSESSATSAFSSLTKRARDHP